MTISQKEARRLTREIRQTLENLEENLKYFHAVQAWSPLGYDSFREWWDAELGSIPISIGLRNWVVYSMVEEYQKTPKGRVPSGAYAEVAEAVGAPSSITIRNMFHRTKARSKNKMTGMKDDDSVTLSVITPNLWRRHIIKFAVDHELNMADVIRPLIKEGMKRKHGVDISEPILTRKSSEARR